MNRKIKFSVVIPTHNRPEKVVRAVESVLRQDYDSMEIIVVNDGSTVPYEELLQIYYDRIVYVPLAVVGGVSFARNCGISAAKGEWVVFLDDDDSFNDGYLKALLENEESHKDIELFWSDVRIVLQLKGDCALEKIITFPNTYESAQQVYHKALTIGAGYGLAIKKNVLDRLGYFDATLKVGEDTELILRLASNGIAMKSVSYTGVTIYENHQERLSHTYKAYSELNIYEKLFEKYAHFLNNNKVIYQDLLHWCVKIHFDNANYSAAIDAHRILKEM